MKPFVRSVIASGAKPALAVAIVCSFLLGQVGCGIPALRAPEPGPMLPPSFNGNVSDENSSCVMSTQFFDDPHLVNLINEGLGGNQELKILAQNIARANNDVLRRRGSLFPFVTFGAQSSLTNYSLYTPFGSDLKQIVSPLGGPFPNPLPDFLVAANVTWQVDIWRQLRNARDAAGLRYLGTQDGWNYVVTRLVADIADNYYRLMALDQQIATLDGTIALQEQSLKIAIAQKEGARGTELGVQRFQAELAKNRSQKLIVYQEMIEAENRINFLVGRYPQPVPRASGDFINLNLHTLYLGVPANLMQNRPDIRQAERNLEATGLDVRVARANFYPKLVMSTGVGYEAFNTRYLFDPESLIYNAAGGLVAPLVNKRAIQADFLDANADQLEAMYQYQRTTLNAFTEVITRVSAVQNYGKSIEIKKVQLASLESAVDVAGKLFQNARVEYIDVLFAQRDRNEARIVLIDTKRQQLSAIVNAYQALGGGWRYFAGERLPLPEPQGGIAGPPVQMSTDLPPVDQTLEDVPPPPVISEPPADSEDMPPPPVIQDGARAPTATPAPGLAAG
jgi:NodT family efflux transporter outer membrane factor (OMF) lipoprotein